MECRHPDKQSILSMRLGQQDYWLCVLFSCQLLRLTSRASDICSDFSSGLQDFFEIPQSKSAQQLLMKVATESVSIDAQSVGFHALPRKHLILCETAQVLQPRDGTSGPRTAETHDSRQKTRAPSSLNVTFQRG
ncbi:hypothetical protein E4U10_001082 [Claviceps purpurea]|nr:hypothetical protein E4U12_001521 [Claviceps purpurea]KAG6187280.1 hypothetical protein E4U36_008198 [Claviceps purpurea]KAG6196300.1 hypothetical protein E4U10_001082 [Claviceps purpurea]KAG6213940.1 hypothetical protein E4U26_000540 [Claviceps purpurea]